MFFCDLEKLSFFCKIIFGGDRKVINENKVFYSVVVKYGIYILFEKCRLF